MNEYVGKLGRSLSSIFFTLMISDVGILKVGDRLSGW